MQNNKSSGALTIPIHSPASQFDEINQQVKAKLDEIDKKNNHKFSKKYQQKIKRAIEIKLKKLKPDVNLSQSLDLGGRVKSKEKEEAIKKQFIQKLKSWSKQKNQVERRKIEVSERRQQQKLEKQERKQKQKAEEQQFAKLQKKKQLQQKIREIQQRRKSRQESLKNAVLKRSYNGLPKYLEYEQQFQKKQDQKILFQRKLFLNRKEKMTLDAEELKLHEKAYIERIKQRLKMKPQENHKRKTNSDFNLYINRSNDLKKAELEKVIRRKKIEEKIRKMPILIDQQKQQQVMITVDKAKNPHKYHILSQKNLSDKQIFKEFKDFDLQVNAKQLGKNYLQQIKRKDKNQIRKAQSQPSLPSINSVATKLAPQKSRAYNDRLQGMKETKIPQKQKQKNENLEKLLERTRKRDSKYLKSVSEKLTFLL